MFYHMLHILTLVLRLQHMILNENIKNVLNMIVLTVTNNGYYYIYCIYIYITYITNTEFLKYWKEQY